VSFALVSSYMAMPGISLTVRPLTHGSWEGYCALLGLIWLLKRTIVWRP
jgi:hypothetical protein